MALFGAGIFQFFKSRLFGRKEEEEPYYGEPDYEEGGPEAGADAGAEGEPTFSLAKSADSASIAQSAEGESSVQNAAG